VRAGNKAGGTIVSSDPTMADGAFNAEILIVDRTATVSMTGEVDLEVDARLAQLAHSATQLDAETVIYDLSRVTFFGSTGVRALLQAERLLGDRFRLGACSAVVERVLEITGTADELHRVDR
jgi:anti-sigma B factor antagonist